MDENIPEEKLILVIPTFARTWRVRDECFWCRRHPPYEAIYVDRGGALTRTPGLLAYQEICHPRERNPLVKHIPQYLKRRIITRIKRGEGSFAYDVSNPTSGTWASYEHPLIISDKLNYIKEKDLGGVGIYEISLDDFKNICITGSVMRNILDKTYPNRPRMYQVTEL